MELLFGWCTCVYVLHFSFLLSIFIFSPFNYAPLFLCFVIFNFQILASKIFRLTYLFEYLLCLESARYWWWWWRRRHKEQRDLSKRCTCPKEFASFPAFNNQKCNLVGLTNMNALVLWLWTSFAWPWGESFVFAH